MNKVRPSEASSKMENGKRVMYWKFVKNNYSDTIHIRVSQEGIGRFFTYFAY